MKTADNLLALIRNLIRDELMKLDSTEMCRIDSVNAETGTLNITLYSDRQTVIPNIINASKYTFRTGDTGVLFKMGGKLDNCFVIAKANLTSNDN